MELALRRPEPPPAILPFRRPHPPDELLDLEGAFLRWKLPELRGCSPETVCEYRTHLRRWKECFDALRDSSGGRWKYRIIYPVLSEIGREELRIFRSWLELQRDRRGGPRFGPRTINKHLGSVVAILASAWAEEAIARVPKLEHRPAALAAPKLWLTPEQVDSLMEGCAAATWPQDLPRPPEVYWRAFLVLACNYGFRTQELVAYESRMRPLDWSGITWEEASPHPSGQAVCPWGWLSYTPQKQRRKKPEPLVLPLNETTHRWLRAIAPPGEARGPVFPFPLCSQRFYETWRGIVAAAGVRPKPGLDGSPREYLPLHLRKTAVTWLNDHRPGIAEYVTGHADDRRPDVLIAGPRSTVQQLSYDSAENRVLEALLTLPQPESFRRLLPDHQLRLF